MKEHLKIFAHISRIIYLVILSRVCQSSHSQLSHGHSKSEIFTPIKSPLQNVSQPQPESKQEAKQEAQVDNQQQGCIRNDSDDSLKQLIHDRKALPPPDSLRDSVESYPRRLKPGWSRVTCTSYCDSKVIFQKCNQRV